MLNEVKSSGSMESANLQRLEQMLAGAVVFHIVSNKVVRKICKFEIFLSSIEEVYGGRVGIEGS
jgi:hypothetical protein